MGRLLQSVDEPTVVAIIVERDKDACSWIHTDGPEMTPNQAIEFVREHGVVLESGRGPVPSLAEAVAQGPLKGSWWSHPKSKEIFALTRSVRDNDDVLVCRVVGGKVTFVHRRLWPALVRLADLLPHAHLGQIKEEHTPTGQHIVRTVPYPDWVSAEASRLALKLSESEAIAEVGTWLT
jgi:hypothetical protein